MLTEFTNPATLNEMLSAFFVRGMFINDNDRTTKVAGMDNDIIVIADLCTYAQPLANMMTAAALVVGDNVQGVFLYEVAEEFGNWFAESYLPSCRLPPRHDALDMLRELVLQYYAQAQDCDVDQLAQAIGSFRSLSTVH